MIDSSMSTGPDEITLLCSEIEWGPELEDSDSPTPKDLLKGSYYVTIPYSTDLIDKKQALIDALEIDHGHKVIRFCFGCGVA